MKRQTFLFEELSSLPCILVNILYYLHAKEN